MWALLTRNYYIYITLHHDYYSDETYKVCKFAKDWVTKENKHFSKNIVKTVIANEYSVTSSSSKNVA